MRRKRLDLDSARRSQGPDTVDRLFDVEPIDHASDLQRQTKAVMFFYPQNPSAVWDISHFMIAAWHRYNQPNQPAERNWLDASISMILLGLLMRFYLPGFELPIDLLAV